MEWFSDFQNFSPLEESYFKIFSPVPSHPPPPPLPIEIPMHKPHEENNLALFENALAEMDPASPANIFDNIVPWNSMGQVNARSEALVHGVQEMIVPVRPDHPTEEAVRKEWTEKKEKVVKTKKTGQPRRRGVRWTEEEHMLFLMGLNKFGKGDWRSISRYYVISKTPTQVASHAQKYYRRLNSATQSSRRRPSINDIHTVNQATAAASSSTYTSSIPSFPTFQHTYGVGAHVLERILPPSMPQRAYKDLPSSCFFASLRNQQWV